MAVSAVALLNIPGFIERLCKLATRKVSEASGTAALLQELEDWHSWLDNALVLDALMQMAIEEAEQSSTGERRINALKNFSIYKVGGGAGAGKSVLNDRSDRSSIMSYTSRNQNRNSAEVAVDKALKTYNTIF